MCQFIISPTFNEQVIRAAFVCMQVRLVLFWCKKIYRKAACKMLVKLTVDVNYADISSAAFSYISYTGSFYILAVVHYTLYSVSPDLYND